jgi:hypothetical protein
VDKNLLMGLVVALLVVLLLLMLLGWRGRRRRHAQLGAPLPLPSNAGQEIYSVDAFYVATTPVGAPLERVAVKGLAFRARATVRVTDAGLILEIPGEDAAWVPSTDLRGVDRATWTIDRVVETDGLVVVGWVLRSDTGNETSVESYFRFDTAEQAHNFTTALMRVVPTDSNSSQGGTP